MTPQRPRRLQAVASVAVVLLAACHGASSSSAPHPARSAAKGGANDSVEVGYGTASKRDVTGSISSVDGAVTRQTTATSMADLLVGRVPGLEVRGSSSGGYSVRIRGDRSLNADGEPLFVVDGIPVAGTTVMSDLDPREVRRVEVLKDAGSLAAYGSRGANGVILISLKRPPKPDK